MENEAAIVLAAGQGTRMKSKQAKVLHPIAGRPMVVHVLNSVRDAGIHRVYLVVGHQGESVREAAENETCVTQREQLGTGHAVDQCRGLLEGFSGPVLVTYGDTPLFRPETFRQVLDYHRDRQAAAVVITAEVSDPTGYGRIVREGSGIRQIVEHKDASQEERAIREINTGTYCFDSELLFRYLTALTPENVQGEYYLPDVLPLMVGDGHRVLPFLLNDASEALGINDRVQLAEAEAVMQRRIAEYWMREGVTIVDPSSVLIEADCRIGMDTIIHPGTCIQAGTDIGADCCIGPYAVLQQASVGDRSSVGPFAYLRPQTQVGPDCRVGDFVELKNSVVGSNTKIPHHSYIGDADIGAGVNIGCGTITCNYDGHTKHRTVIEDDVFIGSNTNLVAPIQLGRGAYVAAGSTLTDDVPAKSLAIARARQTNKENWTETKGE